MLLFCSCEYHLYSAGINKDVVVGPSYLICSVRMPVNGVKNETLGLSKYNFEYLINIF